MGREAHTAPILVPVFFLTALLLCDIIDQVVIYSSVIKLRTQTLASSKHKGLRLALNLNISSTLLLGFF